MCSSAAVADWKVRARKGSGAKFKGTGRDYGPNPMGDTVDSITLMDDEM